MWHHHTSWRPNHWDASQVRVVTERERVVIATVSPSCPAAKWSLSKGTPQGTPGIKADLDSLWRQQFNRPLQPHEFSSIASLWSTKWLRNDRPTSTWFFWHCSNNASWSSPQKNNDFWKRTAKWMRYTCQHLVIYEVKPDILKSIKKLLICDKSCRMLSACLAWCLPQQLRKHQHRH